MSGFNFTKSISIDLSWGALTIDASSSMTTLDLGSLNSVGDFVLISGNLSLVTFTINNLTTVGGSLSISNNAMTNLDISNLISVGDYFNVTYNSSLSTLIVNPAGVSASSYDLRNNALDQSSVDNFLVTMVNTGLTNRILDLTGGSNATPGTTGSAAIATLSSVRGWTIATN